MEYAAIQVGRRKLFSFALIAIVIGSLVGGVLWNFSSNFLLTRGLSKFSSEQELVDFLRTNPDNAPQSLFQKLVSLWQRLVQGGAMRTLDLGTFTSTFQPSSMLEEAGTSFDYSKTNIQVAGVDEADIVKTDGEYLYLASESVVYILRVYSESEEAKVLSKIDLNSTIAGMFVNGEKLVVMQYGYDSEIVYRLGFYCPSGETSLRVYDVSNRSSPVLERDVTVDGSYLSSRMIGNYVYAVVNKQAATTDNNTVTLPVIQIGNDTLNVSASSIYYTGLVDYSYYFTSVIAVNVQDSGQNPTIESFLLGSTSNIYVSTENIYLTSSIYFSPYGTAIHKISVKDGNISPVVSGNVPGYVLNQFSMDEYNGFFRIATSDGKSTSVHILNQNLEVVGKLEGLAPNENLHSARFMGKRCYLVTFKKIDPLFVIDLEDPANPHVLGKLKIPGYSDYLHPYDENHIIGVGKETVESEIGDFAWYQGVKISLFDVTNVSQPREISKIEIGDRGTDTPVLRDHKAFLFSSSKNLLVLPILLAEIDEAKYPLRGPGRNTHGDFVWQGAYVLNVTLDDGFNVRGGITHIENITELMKSGDYFSSPYVVTRALYIDNLLYTVSSKKVKINSLEDLSEVAVVDLS